MKGTGNKRTKFEEVISRSKQDMNKPRTGHELGQLGVNRKRVAYE